MSPLPSVSASSHYVQIRGIISISAGDALQTEMVINCDIIPRLAVLTRSPNVSIRANAFLMYGIFCCHIISPRSSVCSASNIAAGTKPQIERLLSSEIIRLALVHLRDDTLKVQKECLFVISNACEGGSSSFVVYFASIAHNSFRMLSRPNAELGRSGLHDQCVPSRWLSDRY